MKDKKTAAKILRPVFDDDLDVMELSRDSILDDAMFSFGIIGDCSLESGSNPATATHRKQGPSEDRKGSMFFWLYFFI